MKLRAWDIIVGVQICFMTFTSYQTQDYKEKAETSELQVELTSEQRLENIKSDLKIVQGELTNVIRCAVIWIASCAKQKVLHYGLN